MMQAAIFALGFPKIPQGVHGDATVTLRFEGIGDLTIALRPDLSADSASFMRAAAAALCPGQLYRSESFLMQGRIACDGAVPTVVNKGPCPADTKVDATRHCPSHDPQCGCHGPIMTRGMVGWAGGSSGPDFFVYTGHDPATHWSHDHTIIGEVAEEESWTTLDMLHRLPAKPGGMTMLVRQVPLKVMRTP